MLGLGEYVPIYLQTPKGVKEAGDLMIDDIVYEYTTGKELRVIHTEITTGRICKVTYSDGRSQICRFEENIYTGGNHIIEARDALVRNYFHDIETREYELNNKRISTPLYPDPYIAGALIIFGKYDTPYINLPLDRSAADQLFAHKYNLDFADKLEDNTTFYSWNGTDKSQPITWKEFFPNYDFYIASKFIRSPLIPTEYTRASISDRKKFIMGVFDIGYNKDMFPDSVGIAHRSENRLKDVQMMLWSLGIMSRITYDPNLPIARGREYRLDIIGEYDGYPGLFYDINAIRKNLENHNKFIHKLNPFQLKIKSIAEVKESGATVSYGYMRKIMLEKKHAIYVTENFLPRVSW